MIAKIIGLELSAIQMRDICSNSFSPIMIDVHYILLSEFTKYFFTANMSFVHCLQL